MPSEPDLAAPCCIDYCTLESTIIECALQTQTVEPIFVMKNRSPALKMLRDCTGRIPTIGGEGLSIKFDMSEFLDQSARPQVDFSFPKHAPG